ncbi:hypothetical protein HKX48_002314 [Thoreauomyces humboldtii]|nr:hypothetical protein HKX48_002314 [Thoreauomyces humboldtii]
MEYGTHLLSLAWKFPSAAPYVYNAYTTVNSFVSSLSPDVRGRVIRCKDLAVGVVSSAASLSYAAYEGVLAYPATPPDEWRQPTGILLHPLASLVLLVYPVVQEWEADPTALTTIGAEKGECRLLFVGNRHVYGLDIPALHSIIYKKTGKLPRFAVDPIHFKLPVWKHLLQYLGAVPSDPLVYPSLMLAGYPVICTVSTDPSTTEDPADVAFAQWALENGYAAVPLATLGMDDMYPIRYNLPLRPVHRITSLVTAILPSSLNPIPSAWTSDSVRDATLPVCLPHSYERQYVRFASPLRTDTPAARKLLEIEALHSYHHQAVQPPGHRAQPPPANLIPNHLATRTLRAVDTTAMYLSEVRSSDPRRHVLAPLYNCVGWLRRTVGGVGSGVGGGGRLIRKGSARTLRAVAGWVDIGVVGDGPDRILEVRELEEIDVNTDVHNEEDVPPEYVPVVIDVLEQTENREDAFPVEITTLDERADAEDIIADVGRDRHAVSPVGEDVEVEDVPIGDFTTLFEAPADDEDRLDTPIAESGRDESFPVTFTTFVAPSDDDGVSDVEWYDCE